MHSSPRDWTAAILSLLANPTMNCWNFKDSRMLLPVLSLVLDAEIISLLSYRAFIGYLSLTGSGTNFCSWSSKLSMNMFPLILIASYSPTRPAAPSGTPRTSFYGKRAFDTTGLSLWNSLPSDIKNAAKVKQFKCKLKTFLFKDCVLRPVFTIIAFALSILDW